MANAVQLLKTRRFLPLFLTQFLGAFNDNFYKNALVILITYSLAAQAGLDITLMVTAAAGIFILPFFLFSAIAGQLADKHEKSRLIQIIKIIEIVLMCGAAIGFWLQDIWVLMTILFLMGTQSVFFGPLKYSIIPQHLPDNELIGGNAAVEAGTFLSILLGTIMGGILIVGTHGPTVLSVLVIAVAALGWLSSRYIPDAPPPRPDLKVSYNIVTQSIKIINQARENKDVFGAILGISWFWLVGFVFLAQFPAYGKTLLGVDAYVVHIVF